MQTNSFFTQNPETLEKIQTYAYFDDVQLSTAIEENWQNYLQWKAKSISDRARVLNLIADELQSRIEPLAELMKNEMGKSVSDARVEIKKSIEGLRYFAGHAESVLKNQKIQTQYAQTEIQISSLGPIFTIMPWNYPVWQVIRFAAPTWMLGNTVLLKHSNITAGVAQLLEEVVETQAPILKNIFISHEQTEKVISDPRVRGVTLTGSTRAGKTIAEIAGKHLKKTALELGGNDAYLVFADSDLDQAVKVCVRARLLNAGQSCIAAKRFLIEESIYEKFIEKLLQAIAQEPTHLLLANIRFQSELMEQVTALKKQAQLIWGGELKNEQGAYFPVTVLRDVDFTKYDQELFGPIFCLSSFQSDSEALQIVNQSEFGLGAGLFTQNLERIQYFQKNLEVGMIAVNESIRSDARAPFGGIKSSGFGREASDYGILEFANIQMLGRGKI